jgi:hypothetical protein
MSSKNFKNSRQIISQTRLMWQQRGLERYINQASFKGLSPTEKSNTLQKLQELKDAMNYGGELDPAFRRNKNYRRGIIRRHSSG